MQKKNWTTTRGKTAHRPERPEAATAHWRTANSHFACELCRGSISIFSQKICQETVLVLVRHRRRKRHRYRYRPALELCPLCSVTADSLVAAVSKPAPQCVKALRSHPQRGQVGIQRGRQRRWHPPPESSFFVLTQVDIHINANRALRTADGSERCMAFLSSRPSGALG